MRRRVAAVVVTLAIAAYGVHAYLRTPVEAFPDVTNLQVNVITQSPGLAPPEIERQITIPIERALNGTPGMIRMRSESLFGLSLVYLTFEDAADAFRARILVEQRLRTAELPDGVVPELGPDATPLGEIFHYRIVSARHTLAERRSEQEWNVGPALRRVPGVADVIGRGGFLREIHVEVDPARLHARGLSLEEVEDALERASRSAGGGFLRQGDQQLVVRGVGAFAEPSDVQSAVLRADHGTPVTIGDVARVVVSHVPRQGAVGYGTSLESVEGVVLMRRGENPSVVLDGIHAAVDDLNRDGLPEGMEIVPFYDRTTLVAHTLETVHHSLLEGALLCVAVVWLFLRSLRGSLIVGAVIPLALLVAFIGLSSIGLPANLISMGAIDFGILVDGAVILIENVVHRMGETPPRTTRERLRLVADAAREVARPTLFAMAIIVAALIPVFSLERVEGRIFRPLALTYTFALLGALVFSLTVVPALAALVLRPGAHQAHGDPAFVRVMRAIYARAVRWLVVRRVVALAAALALLGGGLVVTTRLGTEFLPELDEGDFNVFVELPTSISLENGQRVMREVRRRLLAFPEVREVDTKQGRPEDGTDNESVNMGETFVHLVPREQWREGMTKDQLQEQMRASLERLPGIRFHFSQPIRDNVEESISGVRGQVVLKIFGTDLIVMREHLLRALDAVRTVPGVVDASLYRDRNVPQLEITPDRERLARAGISMASAQRTIETALAGSVVSEIWQGERLVPVRLRLPARERADLGRIAEITLSAPGGVRIPLREVADIGVAPGRASIVREGNARMLALKFNVEGRDLGSVVAEAITAVDRRVELPDGYTFRWGGEFENQQRAMARLAIVVPLAVLVVLSLLYLALGSARGAAAVLVVTPTSLTGGAFLLAVSGVNLSVSAMIGFIALLGQVALACLLVIGAIDDLCARGVPLADAAIDGAVQRFRPVVMTTLLAMLGLLPMAVSRGMGAETSRPFALVLIGGMATTCATALLVLPALYTFVAPGTLARRRDEDEEAAP
ncbi:Cobalt-zinc-cadmium resistance protein CzcA [Sandaracinus amylolyticus]|uniref:Cobalt-zinc-cadmium resistance protein CzcA n=1 Tax=Sandaracinus amylolyticus TaxID=927083 RepID=A0A0F6YHR6_9BACT|nr:Cobalt-zinc-cadmium resistance protein CzcA [Sandaracinus amylolyticus]